MIQESESNECNAEKAWLSLAEGSHAWSYAKSFIRCGFFFSFQAKMAMNY